jgi:hypothetical protein
MDAGDWGTIGSLVASLLALAGVVYTSRSSQKATEITAEVTAKAAVTPPYEALSARVSVLEEKVDRLEKRERALVDYVRRVLAWVSSYLPRVHVVKAPDFPVPPESLQDVIPLHVVPKFRAGEEAAGE